MSITTLKAGDKAPSFKTTNQDGKEISLDSLKGEEGSIIFLSKRFYLDALCRHVI